MIQVFHISGSDSDVSVESLNEFREDCDLRLIYNYVKNAAIDEANSALLQTQGRKAMTVEMGEDYNGYPCADLWFNEKVDQKIFCAKG